MIIAVAINPRASFGSRQHAGEQVVEYFRAAGSRWFAGVVSAGFDASVNERANVWRWPRGKSRYDLAMLRELAMFRAINYTVTADGETWQ